MNGIDFVVFTLGIAVAVFIPGFLNILIHSRNPRSKTRRFRRWSFLGAFLGELLWIVGTSFWLALGRTMLPLPVEMTLLAGFVGAFLLTRLLLRLSTRT